MSKNLTATARQLARSSQATATIGQRAAAETREPVSKRADCVLKQMKPHPLPPQALPTHDPLANLSALQSHTPSAAQAAPYESRTAALRGAEAPKDFSKLLLVAEVVEEFATESECRARRILRQNRIKTGWVLLRPRSRPRRSLKRDSQTESSASV